MGPPEENELNDKIVKASKAEMEKENVPMKIRKETLDYDKNNPSDKPMIKWFKVKKTTTDSQIFDISFTS